VDSICIDSKVLGTDKHLICSGENFSWRSTVPSNSWHFSGNVKQHSDRCFDSLLKLGKIEIDISPPSRFVNAMKTVMVNDDSNVPWQRVMPSEAHRAFVKTIIDKLVAAIPKLPIDYYVNTWVPSTSVIRSLQKSKIDVQRYKSLVKEKVGNIAAVESFKPDGNGYARHVTYDRFGSLTGRLTVTNGPSILTLKREYRDLLVPESDGCIVSIDFAALEVRVLLYEAGRRCENDDLYAMIAKELGYDRKAVKGAIISELYGSSKFALGKVLGISGHELDSFVKKVKTYFNTPELLSRIKSQFYETGNVINRYGRSITIDEPHDHIFINYYAQSSGVDVTLLGFSQIVDRFAIEAPEIRPLYLLHDALILDVPKQHLDLVQSIKTVTVPGYIQKFFLKVEKLSCTQ
jgi:hypothetical protein